MSRLDRFTLVTALVGLVADIITLSAFLSVLPLSSDPSAQNQSHLYLFKTLSLFIMLYSWFLLSWTFTRRGYLGFQSFIAQTSDLNPLWISHRMRSIPTRSVSVIGVLVYPILVLWLVCVFFPSMQAEGSTVNIFGLIFFCGLGGLVSQLIVGAIIVPSISAFLPLIYPEMSEYYFDSDDDE